MTQPIRTSEPPIEEAATKPTAPAEGPAAASTPTDAGPQDAKPAWVLSAATPKASQPPGKEDPLARYRRERALPEDPFGDGRKPMPPRDYRDRAALHSNTTVQFAPRLPKPDGKPALTLPAGISLPQAIAAAASVALAAGVGIGLTAAWLFTSTGTPAQVTADEPAKTGAAATATLLPLPKVPPAPTPEELSTVIAKKPVPIATLRVADVTGETNSYIPLALQAEPAQLDGDIILKVSGIPEGAYLTSGHKEEDSVWALAHDEIKDVKLVVPEASPPQIDLAVAAFEPKTGELAAPVKTMTVALSNATILPASAPPPQIVGAPQLKSPLNPVAVPPALAAPIPPPDSINFASRAPDAVPGTQQLVLDGDEALRDGKIKAARSAYEKAWSKGAADGAFGLARSYDPVALASLDLTKAKPDEVRAIAWYERAASAGNTDAAAAIVRLKLKP